MRRERGSKVITKIVHAEEGEPGDEASVLLSNVLLTAPYFVPRHYSMWDSAHQKQV